MVWLLVADSLSEQSRAFQVLVRSYTPGQAPGVVTSLTSTTLGFGSQLSVAVGGVKLGVFGHWMVSSAPGLPSVGAVLSIAIVWASFFVSGVIEAPLPSVTRVGGFGGSLPVLRKISA